MIERRSVCLEHLGRYAETAADLRTLVDELKPDAENSGKVSEIEERIRKLDVAGESNGLNGAGLSDSDQLNFRPNPLYPALSEAVKVEYTKEQGRYGVAARDIEVSKSIGVLTIPLFT